MVTGGARGIGYAAARILATEGAKVALVDIQGELVGRAAHALASEAGGEVVGVCADITSGLQVDHALGQVQAELGPVDIFVSSAAIVDDRLFLETGPADWKSMFDVCLFGPMLFMRAILPGMKQRGYGRVVCLASDSARTGQARLSSYAAAKGGLVALVKSVAQEVGRDGITLNIVSPGATNTELRQKRELGLKEQMGQEKYQRRVANVLKMYPTGRIGEPSDIAGAIAFLASDEASWITGQVLSVNGGFAML